MWKCSTHNLQHVVVVDVFGIKYIKKTDLEHLIQTLENDYDLTVDLDRKKSTKTVIGIVTLAK